jgi:hypothetical protein
MRTPKRNKMTGGWRKLHNDELCNLCSSPNIIKMIKSRKMRWVRHTVCIGQMRQVYKILVGKPKRTDYSEDPCKDRRIILK